MTAVEFIPLPRLQFRWKHLEGFNWVCYYELVLKLREHDIRRKKNADTLTVALGKTRVTRSDEPLFCGSVDVPFRDGQHASWDAPQLGNLPIWAIIEDKHGYFCRASEITFLTAQPTIKTQSAGAAVEPRG